MAKKSNIEYKAICLKCTEKDLGEFQVTVFETTNFCARTELQNEENNTSRRILTVQTWHTCAFCNIDLSYVIYS